MHFPQKVAVFLLKGRLSLFCSLPPCDGISDLGYSYHALQKWARPDLGEEVLSGHMPPRHRITVAELLLGPKPVPRQHHLIDFLTARCFVTLESNSRARLIAFPLTPVLKSSKISSSKCHVIFAPFTPSPPLSLEPRPHHFFPGELSDFLLISFLPTLDPFSPPICRM